MGTHPQSTAAQIVTNNTRTKVAVIGNGPVGVHFVNQLIKTNFCGQITIFGEESCQPYNRVLLSSFLCGEVTLEAIQNPVSPYDGLIQQVNCKVIQISPAEKRIKDQYQQWHSYDQLVIATGSSPYIPSVKGINLTGVYCFRDMRDTLALFARRTRSRHTVVIGGGLLGLETAKSMLKYSTKVTVVQHTPTLMNRQLDEQASQYIKQFAEQAGIEFMLNDRLLSIDGGDRVESVQLKNGSTILCDTVIFATGITPNTHLAIDAKINIRKGIQVDQSLRTNHQDIYAIGECADFEGQVFGLVSPGLEQASILAANIAGEHQTYAGSTLMTELKVLGIAVFSMGKVSDEFANQVSESWTYKKQESTYRRVFIQQGKIVGAVAIGPWSEIKALQQAIVSKKTLWIWHKLRFTRTGLIFNQDSSDINCLPDSTIICNCQQVNLGAIKSCIKESSTDFASLQAKLGVAKVCGTCKPLVEQTLQLPVQKLPLKTYLLVAAFCALLIALSLLFLPSIAATTSVQQVSLNWLWTESLARQISGFSILTLTVFSFLLSLKKRSSLFKWMTFDFWRGTHVTLTALALMLLFIHTGISFGQGLNRWLIINFVAIALVGIGSACIASIEGKVISPAIKKIKRSLVMAHIITFWPLPILLTYHVLSVYYF